MQLSEKQLEEYKRLYKESYQEELSDSEAYKQANDLVNLVQLVLEKKEDQDCKFKK